MSGAAKDPRKVIQGMRNRAQGDRFEQAILNSCAILNDDRGLAAVNKTPEPMKPLARPNARGQFLACFTKKAEPDFHGAIAAGRAILFEAKSTTTDKIEQGVVSSEQAKTMNRYTALGAHCFVLVTFDEVRAYRVPWLHWTTMRERWGRKYATEAELAAYRIPFGPGVTHNIIAGIPTPDNFDKGLAAPNLEDILTAFCGLPYGAPVDGEEWSKAYDRLIRLLYSVSTLTEEKVEKIIEKLDRIDSQDGEV